MLAAAKQILNIEHVSFVCVPFFVVVLFPDDFLFLLATLLIKV